MVFIHSSIEIRHIKMKSGLTSQFTATLSALQLTCDNPLLADRERKLEAVMIQKSSRPHEQCFHGQRLSAREISALFN